jgi:hypothetical protein
MYTWSLFSIYLLFSQYVFFLLEPLLISIVYRVQYIPPHSIIQNVLL